MSRRSRKWFYLFGFLLILSSIFFGSSARALDYKNINYPKPDWETFDLFGSDNLTNLVPNPSFETSNNWSFTRGKRTNTQRHTGSWCSELDGQPGRHSYVQSDKFGVDGNTLYEFSYWIKVSNITRGYVNTTLCYYNASDIQINSEQIPPSTAFIRTNLTDWVQAYHPIKTSSDTAKIAVRFSIYDWNGGTKAWFDDVKLVEFSALMLDRGSYSNPLVLKQMDLPKHVVLNALLMLNDTVRSGASNWSVALNGSPLTVNSASFNAFTSRWDVNVTFPTLPLGIYDLIIETTYDNKDFYSKGKVWIREPITDISIGVITDTQLFYPWHRERHINNTNYVNAFYTIDVINGINPDVVVNTGDEGDAFQRPLESLTLIDYINSKGLPLFFVRGNHDGFLLNSTVYWLWTKYLGTPRGYYSLDLDNYHFTALWTDENSTKVSGAADISDQQLSWIQEDLSEASSRGKYSILMLHTAVVAKHWNTGHDEDPWYDDNDKNAIIDYTNTYGVKIVLQGHMHWSREDIENGVLWIATTSTARVLGGFPYAGFRLIRIENGNIISNAGIPIFMPTFGTDRGDGIPFYSREVFGKEIPPMVEIIRPSTYEYVRGTVDIVFIGYDINFNATRLYINDALLQTWTSSVTQTYSWNTTNLSDGMYILKLVVSDMEGKMFENTATVFADNSMPSASIDAPTDGSYVRDTVAINVTASDANLDRMELYISGDLVQTWAAGGTQVYMWNTLAYTDGKYIITLTVKDKAENKNSTSISVIVDNTEPELVIISPESGIIVGNSVTVRFSTFDANVLNATYAINGGAPISVTGLTSFTIDTTTLTDGTHSIAVTTIDKAGNSVIKILALVVDNTAPSVSITSPAEDSELTENVTVEFMATDAHLATVHLHIDNAVFDVTGKTSYEWDTTKVGDGLHTIKIIATDEAGNTKETQITVTTTNVEKAKGESYIFGRNLGLTIGVPLGLIVGVLAAFVITRKRFAHEK